MPKISLWNPSKGNDYNFADKITSEYMYSSGSGILVHKYEGTAGSDDVTDIQDLLFLENRDRRYSADVIELRGHHSPVDTDYDLSQFGIFLSSDTLRFDFHYNDMIDSIGRKLMSGDVFEVPAQRDVNLDGVLINAYYVVQDALYSSSGHSMTWYPHIWKVRAKKLDGAPEFADIIDSAATQQTLGNEGGHTGITFDGIADLISDNANDDVRNALDKYCKYIGITDAVVDEAKQNVYFHPNFFNSQHFYIELDDNGYPILVPRAAGTSMPPNGAALRGFGVSFPEDMLDGEYFLRIDYTPDRLFQKQGNRFKRIYDDIRQLWTPYNTRLDTYINNNNITTFEDGTVITEKTTVNNAAKPVEDLNAAKKAEVEQQHEEQTFIAKKIGNVGNKDK